MPNPKKRDLSKSAENVGNAAINATEDTNHVTTYSSNPKPPEGNNDNNNNNNNNDDDKTKGRQLISAWVDRNVWADIRDLAQFRAAGGQRNHLGQGMSAGRLVEKALVEYLERNRDELDQFRAFFAKMRKK